MFDFSQILAFARLGAGHNLPECFLLLMIWLSSRGLKKEMVMMNSQRVQDQEETKKEFVVVNEKILNHEGRIIVLETKGK